MKKREKIIILAPHPDDEWIGCGCTILKGLKRKKDIHVIYVTGRVLERVELAKKLSKKFGYSINFLNLTELQISESELNNKLLKIIQTYDKLFIPSKDSHPDHRLINSISKKLFSKDVYEYAIYNDSKNIFKKARGFFHQKLFGSNIVSFINGTGDKELFNVKQKMNIIKEYDEIPRYYDLIRKIN